MIVYDASKAAVRMFTQAAAREVAQRGVRVNAVAPGTVETRPDARARDARPTSSAWPPSASRCGRLGRPDEIAAAVAFLSSSEASYITGHVLVADGGWLA